MIHKYRVLSEEDKVIFEGESSNPFKELGELKIKTFGDTRDVEFRKSEFRARLKSLFNQGGKVTIEILK